ncbi:GNAT family N-acetyltransferase [Paenibacillus sp. JX-17]|uniref:GNAT family N-acetyltransferase n=1 Tax=Paenibacillus lacisoli TaxID=3064525 RepID=A0ABT9CA20_9BACL|nr:GNAT family N-acetyltransferase [Paenibacillus sp. JX-17]MDO7905725.1 GNAT family N-acetyltransferase [Paenibacillus sp. JX-17]
MNIRELRTDEPIPMNLLLLADPSENMIGSYIHRSMLLAAETDHGFIGIAAMSLTKPQTLEVFNIAVDENHQGQGIGRALMNGVIRKAQELHCKYVELGTGNSSLDQLGWYQKLGFRIVGVETDFFTNHYEEPIAENGILCVDMIRMRLGLGS